jgi:glycosyl transferase family 25
MSGIRAYVLTIEPEGGRRRTAMTAELTRSGYQWQFFQGVTADGALRELTYSPLRNTLFNNRSVTPPELGCYASHRAIWRGLIESGDEAALVFEDDARVTDDDAFHTAVADVMRDAGSFDVVKFHDHAPKRVVCQMAAGQTHLVSHKMIAGSTACYLVTRQGARKMLDRRPIVFRAIDDDWTYAWELGVRIWSVHPNPVSIVELDVSAIESERMKARKQRGVVRKLWNLFLTFQKQMKTAQYHRWLAKP